MTELNDGALLEDCTSLKSVSSAQEKENTASKKTVQITETVVETVASTGLQTDAKPRHHGGDVSSSLGDVDCRSCFTRRRAAADDSCSDDTIVSGSNRRHGDSKLQRVAGDIDDADDIGSNLMQNVDNSIRTGVSRTPQVAAVIAMAGRKGRRRLGDLFTRMSTSVNAERVARVASAARRLEQREIQATIRMAIIIAFFCGMWLGFFTVYVINSWCNVCSVPRALDAFFFWLGYSNSSINPIQRQLILLLVLLLLLLQLQ